MQGIFISYRRQDSWPAAERLAQELAARLPNVPIRTAVDMVAGQDVVEAIDHMLQTCAMLLVVIGPRWRAGLDSPNDMVRLLIGRASRTGALPLIPILVGGTAMPEADTLLKFDVLIADIVVAMLRLDLEIARRAAPEPAEVSSQAARTAFASYSSTDRQRVLDRIDAVRIAAGLDVFLDCLSLKPSEQWKPRLDQEIRARDLFLLFWSQAAASSPWVEWEWREALALKGMAAMQIHPLENAVLPPPELEALHFGSVAMYARTGSA